MARNEQQACCEELADCLSPEFFKALADPNRAALLVHLAGSDQEQTLSDMSCCCPIDLSVISRHLGVLRDAGVLRAQKRGRQVYYRVPVGELTASLRRLADALEACCSDGSCVQRRNEDEHEQAN